MRKLTKPCGDKEGATSLFFRLFNRTTLRRYTKLAMSGGPDVLLLHEHKFGQTERDQIRAGIALARADAADAVTALSKDIPRLGSNTVLQLKEKYRLSQRDFTQENIHAIRSNWWKISAGLNSQNLVIKVPDNIYLDESGYKRKKPTEIRPDGLGGPRNGSPGSVIVEIAAHRARDVDDFAHSLTHEVAHSAGKLVDHGKQGYTTNASTANAMGIALEYAQEGLTFPSALVNADSYAAFSGDLRRFGSNVLGKESTGQKLSEENLSQLNRESGYTPPKNLDDDVRSTVAIVGRRADPSELPPARKLRHLGSKVREKDTGQKLTEENLSQLNRESGYTAPKNLDDDVRSTVAIVGRRALPSELPPAPTIQQSLHWLRSEQNSSANSPANPLRRALRDAERPTTRER